MGLDKLLSAIVTWAQAQPEILAVYLYGSQAKGYASALSDVDVAILARQDLSRQKLWQLEANWITQWPEVVDMRVLNLAPLPFRYEVSAHGQRLWASDTGVVADIVSLIWRQYWDWQPYLEHDWQQYVTHVMEQRDEVERQQYQAALAKVKSVHRRVREAADDSSQDI